MAWGRVLAGIALVLVAAACSGDEHQAVSTTATPQRATTPPVAAASPTAEPSPTSTTPPTPEPLTSTTTDLSDDQVQFVENLGGGLELWCGPVPTISADPESFGLEFLPVGTITPKDEDELVAGLTSWLSAGQEDPPVLDIGPTAIVPHQDGVIVARLLADGSVRADIAVHLRRTTDGWSGTWLRACSGLG